jgi:hypothetical protein
MLKTRSSAIGKIVTGISLEPIPLTEKQTQKLAELRAKESKSQERKALEAKLVEIPEAKLSSGANTYIRGVFYGEKFDFQKTFTNKFTEKGTVKEAQSIKDICKHLGFYATKNLEHLSNDWIKGTPDVRVKNPRITIDIKNVYYPDGLRRFKDEQEENDYIWQIHGYNFLDEKTDGFICRILMNPPANILEKEVWNYWKSAENEGNPTEEFRQEIEDYFDFEGKKPIEDRYTLTHVKTTDKEINIIKKAVELSREYWAELEEEFHAKNDTALELLKNLIK